MVSLLTCVLLVFKGFDVFYIDLLAVCFVSYDSVGRCYGQSV